jgi:hypothetical protein
MNERTFHLKKKGKKVLQIQEEEEEEEGEVIESHTSSQSLPKTEPE